MRAFIITIVGLLVPPLASVAAAGPPLSPVPIRQVTIDDDFWAPRLKLWREVTIPDCLTKFENDRGGAFDNFDRVRDGLRGGHAGPSWYDGLVYEMVRAGADFLAAGSDPRLEQRLDGYVDRIAAAAAKDPDGYLNTWTQLEEPEHRWGLGGGDDVKQHDLYNAGALVEAGVHYYQATGKTRLLEVAVRLANHMADLMGPPPRRNIVPGHSLGEEALVSLHRLFRDEPGLKSKMPVPVDEARYLALAQFWIENRGRHAGRANFGAYAQDHLPVLEQTTIEGHAVRATLLGAGLVAAAVASDRHDQLDAARRLWGNMVGRRMYVNGGLGAVAGHEGFGPDHELPNTGYLETCAAVGAGFFHQNMALALADARYVDELERVLYNAVLPGISLAGTSYFYENPLESGPTRARWAWHDCPCCPPMFLKIMGALPSYIYAQGPDAIYLNLYVGSRATLTVGGTPVRFRQTTRHPWEGNVRLAVEPERDLAFGLRLRLPSWCESPALRLNGRPVEPIEKSGGYARLDRTWRKGDVVELSLPMPARRIRANPRVEADRGRVALARGPLVYCLEAVDHGGHVRQISIPPEAPLTARFRPELLGGVAVVEGPALAVSRVDWGTDLYRASARPPGVSEVAFMAIPYFANANRQPGEMRVWVPEGPALAQPIAAPSLASGARPSASRRGPSDSIQALNDQVEPAASDDRAIARFTWWDHRGTTEWVQYDFDSPRTVSSIAVYWWDERRIGAHCRVPRSWRLLHRVGDEWMPVAGASGEGGDLDRFNRVSFAPVETNALRLEVQLQPGWSGGILEWRVE